MLTHDRIEEVRRQAQVSMIDAVHALSTNGGNVELAVEELNGRWAASHRAVIVEDRGQAARLAAALVDSAVWFECEATTWGARRFSVAPGAYPRLRMLQEIARIEPKSELPAAA